MRHVNLHVYQGSFVMNGMLNIAFSGEFRFSRFKKAYISYTTLLPSQPPRLGILSPHKLKYCLFLNPPWYKLKTIVITTVLSSTDSILASLPRLPRLPRLPLLSSLSARLPPLQSLPSHYHRYINSCPFHSTCPCSPPHFSLLYMRNQYHVG